MQAVIFFSSTRQAVIDGNSVFGLVLTSHSDFVAGRSYRSSPDDVDFTPGPINLGLLKGRFPGDWFGNVTRQMGWKGSFHQGNVNNNWEDLLDNQKATIAKDGRFG